ncbi:unnamed protein product [Allacma fusca]|uniref:Protein Wnt n=1 Tax=Allacma fusca TaxID=39272 RepID=A0A8J2JD20_9HEXA|nr:unnamed protein product [Allacma fusca]
MTPIVSVLIVFIGFTCLLLVGAMVPQSSARVPTGRGRGSKWWGIAKVGEPTNLIQNTIRGGGIGGSYLEPVVQAVLRKKQQRLVRENRGVLEAIAKGANEAIVECKHQFRNRRWNCPTKAFWRGKNIFGKIVDKGCRETAFLYAITSAAVTHAVVRACSEGAIESCTCDYRLHNKYSRSMSSDQNWKWGSCSDNIEFGYKFSRDFVDAGEKIRDMRGTMNLHNNEAGRMHVQSLMRRQCKCHGMSGSCTMKTCWMRLPNLREVGNSIKDRFDGASRVLISNAGSLRDFGRRTRYKFQLKPYNPDHKPPSKKDLVFFEDSPNFCDKDARYGVSGTVGRACNVSSMGVDGCDLMCCGRGYTVSVKTVVERCKCTFKWCCQVECKNCTVTRTYYTCK